MIDDCTAIILAGGDSKRMGQDKANLLLGEQSLLQHAIAAMQKVFPKIILSVRESRPGIHLKQIIDEPSIGGPLAGVLPAMEASETPWVFILACDMPFIMPSVIEALAHYRGAYQAVIPIIQGNPQTLASFYRSDITPSIRNHLENGGKNSLRALLNRLQIRYVNEDELTDTPSASVSFVDLDTPQDLIEANQRIAS